MRPEIKINSIFDPNFRGVLVDRAEIIPFEPDVDNPTVGKKTALRALLVSFSLL